jgi:transcription elongation factor GreA
MSQEMPISFLTQDAYNRLSAELEHLSTTGRDEIAKKIEEARSEGDLRENGGYHAAKDEQAKIEARISTLTQLLRTATVSEAPVSRGVVEPGLLITATIAGDETVFILGNREIAGDTDTSVYSEQSPLGSAIIGLKVGESTSYKAPNGKDITVTINKVDNFA